MFLLCQNHIISYKIFKIFKVYQKKLIAFCKELKSLLTSYIYAIITKYILLSYVLCDVFFFRYTITFTNVMTTGIGLSFIVESAVSGFVVFKNNTGDIVYSDTVSRTNKK